MFVRMCGDTRRSVSSTCAAINTSLTHARSPLLHSPPSLFHFLAVTSFALVVQNKSLFQHSVVRLERVWRTFTNQHRELLRVQLPSLTISATMLVSLSPLFLLLAPWFSSLILFYFVSLARFHFRALFR